MLLTEKKKKLDRFRPLPVELVKNLDDWFRIELTYSSNAIEGNTLTRFETALVVEKGLTVNGKTLKEHLEAINHAGALDFIKELVKKKRPEITEKNVLDIHAGILRKIDDANVGRYRNVGVRIAGVPVALPNPLKVPDLMRKFYQWLHNKNPDHPVKIGADAHLRFVTIHPFADRNGRTARLLLNLLLLQQGYPPALIRKEERRNYINAVGKAQLEGDTKDYYEVIYKAVDRSFNIYLEALNPQSDRGEKIMSGEKQLLRIGELAQETREPVPTIRHWTEVGVLEVKEFTDKGYQLYSRLMIEKVKEIRKLQQEEYLPLEEIRKRLIA
ncbi:cell filamentation protein Fic [Candidatus Roizmanbacteria bacterium RIFCSPHIGHO2_01_FULL_35_10]|uniref:Cell filamentation protein Fic n=1 Tax=Candidatus Roizmanbacteria bacterium RIFCSPLOWO2_01_FULL_35_13 TaxID=1802055 RepID=A0A1F7ICV2_9BACT|nr:MAG: cell filamentation protein Fic [Candidatus Roizmanbacteria bacterium RIFCSPHIGHO2_01_FULL_35_10]OGK41176.1 MAG: cell filamentation protein Fic [Candidatus Roizmanbacteria bacterium RIFCSPLOWO2_01_FULL_35_13]